MQTDRKAKLWQQWIDDTLLQDISQEDTPDPIPLLQTNDGNIELHELARSYKYGENVGDYLYILYLLDNSIEGPGAVTPVYIGESNNISTRLTNHVRKLREALPTADWVDSGAWGSFSKYDHMALVYERTANPLCVWICDVNELAQGPYGDQTYREELEAKLVGLVHAQDGFEGVFTNREFVPNQILHDIGAAGPEWVPNQDQTRSTQTLSDLIPERRKLTKLERWKQWIGEYILPDIRDPATLDPIPLLEVDEALTVQTSEKGSLKRTSTIDDHIRHQGKQCVDQDGVLEDGCEGLLYVMYQLAAPAESAGPMDFVPRYIGKAEAYGKERTLSSNFVEIANDRSATRSFARWGDGNHWHIGELSMALRGEDKRKKHWVEALFEPGTRRLRNQAYLWVHAWDSDRDVGPYGVPATLAEVEPLLIGLAYSADPKSLLNKSGTPDQSQIRH